MRLRMIWRSDWVGSEGSHGVDVGREAWGPQGICCLYLEYGDQVCSYGGDVCRWCRRSIYEVGLGLDFIDRHD